MKKKEQRVSSKKCFQATDDGNVEITINAKYIEGLVEVLGLEKAYTKKMRKDTECVDSRVAPCVSERSWDS